MTNFKICPSFFSPTEQIVPHVHNVQCWLFNSLKVSYLCHINHFIRRYRLFFDQQNTIYNSTGFSPKNKWVKIEMASILISHWEEWEFSSPNWKFLLEYSTIGRFLWKYSTIGGFLWEHWTIRIFSYWEEWELLCVVAPSPGGESFFKL